MIRLRSALQFTAFRNRSICVPAPHIGVFPVISPTSRSVPQHEEVRIWAQSLRSSPSLRSFAKVYADSVTRDSEDIRAAAAARADSDEENHVFFAE